MLHPLEVRWNGALYILQNLNTVIKFISVAQLFGLKKRNTPSYCTCLFQTAFRDTETGNYSTFLVCRVLMNAHIVTFTCTLHCRREVHGLCLVSDINESVCVFVHGSVCIQGLQVCRCVYARVCLKEMC